MIKETCYRLDSPLSIALVTDTHNHPAGQVYRSLKRRRPEIICIAGDFLYARLPESGLKMNQSLRARKLLRACSRLAPTFVSLGNHEWMLNEEDMRIIRSTGVTLLDNEYTDFKTKEGKRLVIGGLTSAACLSYRAFQSSALYQTDQLYQSDQQSIYPYIRQKSDLIQDYQPDIQWLDDFERQPGYRILLCHHPEYYPDYLRNRKIQLILSGHAHGGQIRILGQGLFAPGQGFLPKLTSGVVDQRLVISRGLADNTIVPRICNPKEIVYIIPRP